ncbi:MAG: branched-chain amino acid transaminase [Deltaproteobacteria bacterium]|nr:branched-chain amino acid transaminase [Deltaproteobacteria bacterium]
MDKLEAIWLDGKMLPWDAAKVHVLTHTMHYGVGAFEGIRAYKRASGETAIFRLREHIQRLFDSCKILQLEIPHSLEAIEKACAEVLVANKLDAGYLRPLVYLGDEQMGLYAPNNTVHLTIIAWRWGAYLGDDGLKRGIRAKVSSFTRAHVNSTMAKGKIVGHYVNSIMAKREVKNAGYDEAIMLDSNGYVAEATGENLFMVRRGVIRTPSTAQCILEGITRDSVMTLARELGYTVQEGLISRDELYTAEEVFLCGTAAEITPVREIDNRTIGTGTVGPVTARIQARYFEVVRGSTDDYAHWRSPV